KYYPPFPSGRNWHPGQTRSPGSRSTEHFAPPAPIFPPALFWPNRQPSLFLTDQYGLALFAFAVACLLPLLAAIPSPTLARNSNAAPLVKTINRKKLNQGIFSLKKNSPSPPPKVKHTPPNSRE